MKRFTGQALKITCATALSIGLAGVSAPALATTGATPPSVIQVASEVTDAFTFSPSSGGVAASTTVTFKGDGIGRATEVRFGDVAGKILPGAPAGQLRVQAPTAKPWKYEAKKVPVVVVIDGTPKAAGEYSYVVSSGIDKQMNYTLKHWSTYNRAQYSDFNPRGGDCMNFVSQTLVARGFAMNDLWHNRFKPGDELDNWASWTTGPWISVSRFDKYAEDHQKQLGLTHTKMTTDGRFDRSKIKLGDVAIFEWADFVADARPADVPEDLWELLAIDGDHAMVVTELVQHADGTTSVKLAGHNNDRDFLDLDYILSVSPIVDGRIWHIPA
jgi:hypothetical protein